MEHVLVSAVLITIADLKPRMVEYPRQLLSLYLSPFEKAGALLHGFFWVRP